ncbi:hypothetical protein F-liban_423 [Faustovirus]|nr:hypothetical protein F-liban_423 [Faustovirus]SME65114.1 Hypothetical protein FSTVST1_413 [Faustovirus ST1]
MQSDNTTHTENAASNNNNENRNSFLDDILEQKILEAYLQPQTSSQPLSQIQICNYIRDNLRHLNKMEKCEFGYILVSHNSADLICEGSDGCSIDLLRVDKKILEIMYEFVKLKIHTKNT